MICPHCGGHTAVKDSRASQAHNTGFSIRRRRQCAVCDRRFTTYELTDEVVRGLAAAAARLELIADFFNFSKRPKIRALEKLVEFQSRNPRH